MNPRETRLRSLCFWYELNGQADVAGALQDAADAVAEGALSPQAADALIDVWRPFLRLETAAPDDKAVERSERLDVVRFAVTDLRRKLNEADDPDKPRIAALLRQQVAILEGLERGAA